MPREPQTTGPLALLVVDVQNGFDDPQLGPRNNPDAEANIARLLAFWRRHGWPVLHARHMSTFPGSPLRPGQPGNEIKPEVRPLPPEPVLQKTVNSVFIGTDLEKRLHESAAESLVIVGLTTDHCVSTTARMAANLGFRTWVVSDATATFDRVGPDGRRHPARAVHDLALVSLHDEFATIVDTANLLDTLEPGPATSPPAPSGRLSRRPAR